MEYWVQYINAVFRIIRSKVSLKSHVMAWYLSTEVLNCEMEYLQYQGLRSQPMTNRRPCHANGWPTGDVRKKAIFVLLNIWWKLSRFSECLAFSMLQYYINVRVVTSLTVCTIHARSTVWIVKRIARLLILADENEVSRLSMWSDFAGTLVLLF